MENLLSLSKYIDVMRKLTALATGVKGISYFIATDDIEAEKMMRSSFEDGAAPYLLKLCYPKDSITSACTGCFFSRVPFKGPMNVAT